MEREAAFLVALAEYGIRPDMQEVMVRGNPDLDIRPGALKHALAAIQAAQMEAVAWLIGGENEGRGQFVTDRRNVMEAAKARDLAIIPLYASPVPSSERDEIIEMCAKVADDYGRDGRLYKELACETADELAARIRALKGGA